MFKRLSYSLFKPKHIALFLKDKVYMSIIYFIIAVICCAMPKIVVYLNTDYSISQTSFSNAVSEISKYKDCNAKIVDGKFSVDTPFSIVIDENTYYFGNQVVSENAYFYFSEDSLNLVESGITSKLSYKDLGYLNLDFTILDTSSTEAASFRNMMNNIYYTYLKYSDSVLVISQLITTFIDVGVSMLIIYLFISAITPMFKSSYRFNLAVYSMTWFYVIYIFGSLLNNTLLEFLGLIVAFFFIRKALSSVRIINIKK